MSGNRGHGAELFFYGPMRWDQLSPELEGRARRLFYSCGMYLVPTFEQWECGFCREQSPEKEMQVWEEIDEVFRDYFTRHELTPEMAAEVVYHLLALSLGMEKPEALFQELKRLYLTG